MELAKITSKGQITIPKDIRDKLNLRPGDKVIFIEEDGKIIFANSSVVALRNFQAAMNGEAERAGIKSIEDVDSLIENIRQEVWEIKHANND